MFDELLKELKRLDGAKIEVSIPLDDDGYMDRKCPAEACQAEFKILAADWKAKVSDEQVYCPICREEAEATEWNTPEQQQYFKDYVEASLQETMSQAMRRDAERFNRKQPRNAFIRMSLSVKPGMQPIILPLDVADSMRQKFTCPMCSCRYASIGAAFFCPACGHNSSITSFDQTIDTVQKIVAGISALKAAISSEFDKDVAQNSVRQILESSLERLVGAFQRHAEDLFQRSPNAANIKQPKNVFQRLQDSSTLWEQTVGKRYEDLLSASEMQDLTRLFQQRHLIAHRDGIVDQEYINKSGDTTYSVGQRLVIREAEVLKLANLVSSLAKELQNLV